MKFTIIFATLASGVFHGQAIAAVTYVDWLRIPAPSGSAFTLVGDGGAPVAGGTLNVLGGTSFPNLPSSVLLGGEYWGAEPQFKDTLLGDASVWVMEFRVMPINGIANYVIEFAVPSDMALVLAVGNLLTDANSSTAGVAISVLSDSGAATADLAGTFAWNSGVTSLTQELDWNAATGNLSPAAAANGETQMAFFNIAGIQGENAMIRLSVPNGYGAGLGDSIYVALGQAIPEPSIALLGALGSLLLLRRRRAVD